MTEKLIAAAVLTSTGTIIAVAPPARHGDVIRHMIHQGSDAQEIHDAEQGFLTDAGRFVDRQEAYRIAKGAGQFIRPEIDHVPGTLFSENLF